MWDIEDMRYGWSRKSKDGWVYSAWGWVVGTVAFLEYGNNGRWASSTIPMSWGEAFAQGSLPFLFGVFIYTIVLYRRMKKEVHDFRSKIKPYLLREGPLSRSQAAFHHQMVDFVIGSELPSGPHHVYFLKQVQLKMRHGESLTERQREALNRLLLNESFTH